MDIKSSKPRKASVKPPGKVQKSKQAGGSTKKREEQTHCNEQTQAKLQPKIKASSRMQSKPKKDLDEENKLSIPIIKDENGEISSEENAPSQKEKMSVKRRQERAAKKEHSPSSLSPDSAHRRNGCAHDAFYLRSSPTSPPLSPSTEDESKGTHSPRRRRAIFGEKNAEQATKQDSRRDAVCKTTDKYSQERIAVRVIFKKF